MAGPVLGCRTTMDIVQQQYNTTSAHGVKRSFEVINADSVLRDISNNATFRDSPRRQDHRGIAKNRLTASSIFSINSPADNQTQLAQSKVGALPLPGPSQNPLLSLSHSRYALPQLLAENLAGLGISSIYPWQSSCLLGRGLLEGERNLVYTAPTGGGKSLVADVLMLKRVIEDPSKKAILVLPYVALVQEKLKWLRRVVEGVQKNTLLTRQADPEAPKWRKKHDSSVRVVGFFGGSKVRATWADVDIAICTIEKVAQIKASFNVHNS